MLLVGKHGDLLESCPFCGRWKLHVYKYDAFRCNKPKFTVTCKPCQIGGRSSVSRTQAITYWNTRTPEAAPHA